MEDAATAEATIVTIDLHDGTRVAEPHPGAVGALAVPGGLVVVEATDEVTEEIVLIADDGTERWRVTGEAANVSPDGVWLEMRLIGDSVMFPMSESEIDLATGVLTQLSRWTLDEDIWIAPVDGEPVVTTPGGSFTLLPGEAWLTSDDDFGGPIALTQTDEAMVAQRRADGQELWRIQSPECFATTRLLGTVVAQCWGAGGQRLHALDQVTGNTRWELDGAAVLGSSDRTLLVADDAERAVMAVDAADGSVLWSLPMATHTGQVTELPDGILIATDTMLLRLLWE